MQSSVPQTAALKQTSKEDNRLSVANFAANENISESVIPDEKDNGPLLTQNSFGESSPIQISSSDSGNSSNFTSVTDMDTESSTRIIQSDSSNSAASSSGTGSSDIASNSSGSGSSGSSGASGSGSSDTGSSDSSGTSSSGSATADSAGSSDAGDSGSAPAGGSGSAGGGGSTDADDLSKLKPLPKVHYSWGLDLELLTDINNEQLYQVARITHSLCVASIWVSERHINTAVYICARINKTNPAIPASIGVNYSPYHPRFDKDLPPTNRGVTYEAELKYFTERINLIKEWVYASNLKYGSDVRISALLLDSERFYVKSGNTVWNEGIRDALDTFHLLAKSLVPEARIEWYDRGMTLQGGQWIQTPTFTGREIIPSLSCSLYSLPVADLMLSCYTHTCELADKMKVADVTPWVAIAAGWYKKNALDNYVWEDDYDFDTELSYQMGRDMNSTRPPFEHTKVVVFFPAPFFKNSPAWEKHFIQYCKGAASGDLK